MRERVVLRGSLMAQMSRLAARDVCWKLSEDVSCERVHL